MGILDVGSAFTLNPAQIRQAQSVHPEFVFPFVPDTSSAANASYFTEAGIAGLRPDASFFEPNFRNPRSFNVTAGIEQLLSPNLALSLDWVHSNTVYLERIRDTNLAPPVLSLDGSNPPVLRPRFNTALRPNPNFNILAQPGKQRPLQLRRSVPHAQQAVREPIPVPGILYAGL